jgi:hypothetical protein
MASLFNAPLLLHLLNKRPTHFNKECVDYPDSPYLLTGAARGAYPHPENDEAWCQFDQERGAPVLSIRALQQVVIGLVLFY